LCLAYVLPGFIGREPWKNADISAFGVMAQMARGQTDWWMPTILSTSIDTPAWLPYWLGALAIQLWPATPELAARLPYMGALVATLFFTWHAVYRFALQPMAQPVVFAFGGQAQPVDYARALADSGLMALLACLGLAQLAHEATPDVFQLASVACLLYSSALLTQSHHPRRSATLWLGGLLCLALSGKPVLSALLGSLTPILVVSLSRQHGQPNEQIIAPTTRRDTWLWLAGMALSASLGALALWCRVAGQWANVPSTQTISAFMQMLAWFTWPTWPLVIWTLWRWRHHIQHPHLAFPLLFSVLVIASSLLQDGSDRLLMLALPAMATLAAFALPTLRRSVSALIDWFSVLFFSASAVIIWVVWMAMVTGYPKQPAANVARLAPGFTAEFGVIAFSVASLGTVAWLAVVAWRMGRHPPVIWKSLVLPATGGVLCWLLLLTLWLPLLDYGRSYGPLARRVATLIPVGQCVQAWGLSQAQVTGLTQYGHLELHSWPNHQGCHYLITSSSQQSMDSLKPDEWAFDARINRLNDNREALLLYTKITP
jgi:hypothetical protein